MVRDYLSPVVVLSNQSYRRLPVQSFVPDQTNKCESVHPSIHSSSCRIVDCLSPSSPVFRWQPVTRATKPDFPFSTFYDIDFHHNWCLIDSPQSTVQGSYWRRIVMRGDLIAIRLPDWLLSDKIPIVFRTLSPFHECSASKTLDQWKNSPDRISRGSFGSAQTWEAQQIISEGVCFPIESRVNLAQLDLIETLRCLTLKCSNYDAVIG